ncbi:MAG: cytochrome c [Pseudomonadota bacterium]
MKKRASLSCIITSLFISLFAIENGFAASGEDIFKSKECGACHSMTGSPAESFEEQQKKKGPDLWYAGSKYQEKWLENYLQKPENIRPLAFGSIKEKNELKHLALSAADAKAVTAYLASLKSTAVTKGAVKKANKGVRGKILFKKKQACYGCHRIPGKGGKESGGFSGPSFVGAGERLQGDWIYSFIKDPKPFIAAGRMPHYKHLKAKEIKTISEYMMSFK